MLVARSTFAMVSYGRLVAFGGSRAVSDVVWAVLLVSLVTGVSGGVSEAGGVVGPAVLGAALAWLSLAPLGGWPRFNQGCALVSSWWHPPPACGSVLVAGTGIVASLVPVSVGVWVPGAIVLLVTGMHTEAYPRARPVDPTPEGPHVWTTVKVGVFALTLAVFDFVWGTGTPDATDVVASATVVGLCWAMLAAVSAAVQLVSGRALVFD